VALLSDRYGGDSGIGQHTSGLYNALSKLGLKIDVYSNVVQPEVIPKHVLVHRVGLSHKGEVFACFSSDFHMLLKGITRADILHTMAGFGWITTRTAKSLVPLVNTVHGRVRWTPHSSSMRAKLGGIVIRSLEERNLFSSRAVIAVSEHVRDYLAQQYGLVNKVKIVSNGIDENDFMRFVETSDHIPPNRNCILLSVTRLSKERKPWRLLFLTKELLKYLPNVQLVVIGKGPLLPLLSDMRESMHLGNHVLLLGSVNHNELPRYYSACSLYVATPTAGITVLEASAAGKAFVYFEDNLLLPSISCLESFSGGFAASDETDMARLVTKLLSDESRLRMLGRENQQHVRRKYLWSFLARQILDLYSVCLDQQYGLVRLD